ncbi:hypothetical protein [Hymenobacter pini]|uniref:hypothetical protein n=1 Tax=Hymenobacter pini TaxID=2880879 RepID=UPI001CF4565D|nr:hypothetical protein [Hymenobacter pini]MCA8830091.1 hypothetical protein [Hymenobacter pini]
MDEMETGATLREVAPVFMELFRQLVLLILLLAPFIGIAQERKLHIPLNQRGDTTFWYKYQSELAQQLSLIALPKSTHKFHFRLWMDRQAIEIWQESTGSFQGQLVSWAKEHSPEGEEPTNRIAVRAVPFDTVTTRKLYHLIITSSIQDLPDQEQIKEWRQGFDGIEYIIETVDSNEYYLKTYWTPTAQGSLEEAIMVNRFVQDASMLARAQDEWKSFTATIPYECYMNSSMTIACRILSSADKRRLKKARENYRKSQRK